MRRWPQNIDGGASDSDSYCVLRYLVDFVKAMALRCSLRFSRWKGVPSALVLASCEA